MVKYTVLFLALLLFPSLSWAQACPSASQPAVNLTIQQDPVRYDNSYNIVQLQDLMRGDSSVLAGGGRHIPLGLAKVQSAYHSSLQANVSRLENGTFCASLKAMDVDFRFTGTTIFVAVELPRDSCIYREVLTHEHRHVAVDGQLLSDWRMILQQDMTMAAQNTRTSMGSTSQEAVSQLGRQLEPLLKQSLDRLLAERARRQAVVDSPEEYTRVSRACNGELRRYIPEGMLR